MNKKKEIFKKLSALLEKETVSFEADLKELEQAFGRKAYEDKK